MNKTVQRVALGQTKLALVISEITFGGDGFQESQRAGVMSIDPDQDPHEMLEKAKNIKWELYGEPNRINGFYQVRKAGVLEGEEIKETSNSSTSVIADDVAQTK